MTDDPASRSGDGSGSRPAATRPLHLRWSSLGLVALGGMVGTALREGLALTFAAPPGGFPVAILVINLVGSFALGLLLESLVRRGSDEGRRRTARLLVGTGLIGGFTTYSAFAVDVGLLGSGDGLVMALAYAVSSVVLGTLAAGAGIALAGRLHRRDDRPGDRRVDRRVDRRPPGHGQGGTA
ncbi:CrcB family protein [Frigoribacterium sp. CFBP 13712]|uniref:fluoride efflux transporter FluC n=1 Tax=Frigoribacterium sp. CFBP 13712 TaxID=2775309 RepID=UPI00352F69C3